MVNLSKVVFLLVFIFEFIIVHAQVINPTEDAIYLRDQISSIYLVIDPDDLDFLLDEANIESRVYLSAQFRITNSGLDESLTTNVGLRIRGNTSRYHPKKSFKIKFTEFDGDKFKDYKSFNLKAENNDPSFLREYLSLQLFRASNVAAARSTFTKLYINEEYMGLYLNVEQIDDEFIDRRFDEEDGNLYKCSFGASLEISNDVYNNEIFELETNQEINDRTRLESFINIINNAPDPSFQNMIEDIFEVDRFLSYLAVETLIGHWDGYSYNKNNYYLYENESSGKIEFIPYDVDNTFGIDWIGGDWGTRNVLNWANENESRPLVNKILSNTVYYERYVRKLKMLLDQYFTESQLFPKLDLLKDLLSDAVENDNHYPLTFGFSIDDYLNSHNRQVADHVPYGLRDYITTRIRTATEQASAVVTGTARLKNSVNVYPNPLSGDRLIIDSFKSIEYIKLFDLAGRNLDFNINKSNNETSLEADLEAGIYLLQIDKHLIKLIVQN